MWHKKHRAQDPDAPPAKRLRDNLVDLFASGEVAGERAQSLLQWRPTRPQREEDNWKVQKQGEGLEKVPSQRKQMATSTPSRGEVLVCEGEGDCAQNDSNYATP